MPDPRRLNYTREELVRLRDRALAGSARMEAASDHAMSERMFNMAMEREQFLQEKIDLGEP